MNQDHPMAEKPYVLGTHDAEYERLQLQDRVWSFATDALLAEGGLERGLRVLDLGCGPGFVTERIAAAVGDEGSVDALDASPRWRALFEERIRGRDIEARIQTLTARVEEAELQPQSYDLIFSRWLFSFITDIDALVARLAALLRPGGRLVVQDYNHEGISLFPRSAGFDAVVRATRALYAQAGGDAFVATRLPQAFASAGLRADPLRCDVLAGGPGSDAFEWAGAFFPPMSEKMVSAGVLSQEERSRFLSEWQEREADSNALFFSPIVVGAIARRAV